MANPAEMETSERHMAIARRWFTEGWTGNLAMAGGIFSEELAFRRWQGHRDPDAAGPVRVSEADRVSPGERPRRLTGEAELPRKEA
jgi:hypothetical protein